MERQECRTIDEVRAELEEGCIKGEEFAVVDRYDHKDSWRKVILRCIEDGLEGHTQSWQLLDENGAPLDEPPDCPRGGFDIESLLRDIGTEYYDVPVVEQRLPPHGERQAHPPPDSPPSSFPAELDTCRVRLTATGRTATVRTRVGSKDSAMPANKVALLFDEQPGECLFYKPEELDTVASVL